MPSEKKDPDMMVGVVFVGVMSALGAAVGNVLLAGALGAGVTIGILELAGWFSRRAR